MPHIKSAKEGNTAVSTEEVLSNIWEANVIKDFKEFVARGNVIDLAIGVIMGAAFGKIVTSFVNDIIMPPIGMLLGKVDFTNLFINLSGGSYASLDKAKAAGAVTINYGLFINSVIDFMIVAFAIFLTIKQVNRFRRPATEAPAPSTKECPYCLSKINAKATRCPQCTSELAATLDTADNSVSQSA